MRPHVSTVIHSHSTRHHMSRAGRCWEKPQNSDKMTCTVHWPLEPGEAPVCASNCNSSSVTMTVTKKPSPMSSPSTSIAQFIAVCSSSILAETLGYSASFSSPLHGKRRVFEGRKLLLIDQLQPSTNADKLSDEFNMGISCYTSQALGYGRLATKRVFCAQCIHLISVKTSIYNGRQT
jgi:hypothetical protein